MMVVSYLDLAVILGSLGAFAVALLVVGRRSHVRKLVRSPKAALGAAQAVVTRHKQAAGQPQEHEHMAVLEE
jgi:hypothetical protein